MNDFRTEDYRFQREAKRMHRGARLEFEDSVQPLRPLWPLVLAGVVFAAMIAAAFVLEVGT